MKKTYSYGKQSISWSDVWGVIKALRSPWMTQGPKVKEFEDALCKYTGAKYCVAVSNGTAALHLATLCLDLKKDDEVITSPITFVATANSILYAGAKVKFADIDPKTANIDPEEIKKQITARTKAIIPVHFAGQSCDMELICKIAKEHNLFVVEDAAHALGSDYKNEKVGSCKYSDLATFSFHPVKNITTAEGGAIITNNKDFYEKLLMLRTHGITKSPDLLTQNDGPWYYQQHELGFNYRLTDLQCALGLSQLKRIEKFKKRRREIVDIYRKEFAKDDRFSLLEEKDYSNAFFHLCPLLINFEKVKIDKKELFNKLKEKGLNLQVHYIPVYTQPYYKRLGFKEEDYSKSESYYNKTISLPVYYGLKNEDVYEVVRIIKGLCE
jgi:perosamine synthetase